MEEQKLCRRLTLLYVLTAALVLAATFAAICSMAFQAYLEASHRNFDTLLRSVTDRLQTENLLRHSWLRGLERDNGLFIYVEDNGAPLLFSKTLGPENAAVLERLRAHGRSEGVDPSSPPLLGQAQVSSMLRFTVKGRSYRGAACVLPVGAGYRSLVLAQRENRAGLHNQLALYGACCLLALLALSLAGRRLIRRALRPAVESHARQTAFIAAASHELRSPLAVIQANAATLRADPAQGGRALAAIEGECGRMARLLGDMLLLASADAKSWRVSLAPLEADTLLLNVYEAYAPLCRREGFTLGLSLPEGPLPQVLGDPERLSQVFSILLDNAMAYGGGAENKALLLKAFAHKRQVHMQVIDHGPGIPQAQRARVFDRFYRGDGARQGRGHAGLGLSIAQELLSLHGGSLALSDTPGGGCTFTAVLNALPEP